MIDRLRELLIKHEGKKYKVYSDTAAPPKRTIGIGHNIDARGLPPDIKAYLNEHGEITDDMVNTLFAADVSVALGDCLRLYPQFNTFSENRRLALIDFLFNEGIVKAHAFVNTNRAINEGRWEDAAQGFENSLWYVEVKTRGPEFVSMIREG